MSEKRPYSVNQELARLMSPMRDIPEDPIDWRNEALCSSGDPPPDDWFAPEGSLEASDAADKCFECPIRKQCLKWASDSKQQHGIWGGIPASVRTHPGRNIKAHDYETLVELDNPYLTSNERSHLFIGNLKPAEDFEEDD